MKCHSAKGGGALKVNQIRAGAALSYVSMALSTIISLVYTPIMLDRRSST